MDHLNYLEKANTYANLNSSDFAHSINITLITNFTDAVLQKLLTGVCLSDGIFPKLTAVPYKQYHFELKNPLSAPTLANPADITFVWLDMSQFRDNEFNHDKEHFANVARDLEIYCQNTSGTVVINTFILPYQTPYGEFRQENPLYQKIVSYNERLAELAKANSNVYICDTNALTHELGFASSRDLRSSYAYDLPFTQTFTAKVAELWCAYIRAKLGKSKKAIILDLDNVLWGGVVGEAGPLGIQLGPDYPGNAFQNFQRTLLEYYERGIILAINSKNNKEDVDEVFAKNPHMILKPEHFAAIYANWNDKASNLISIANELNIGLDSFVFFDDEPMNRDLVRTKLPEVLTPEFSLPPEDYAPTLLSLNVFHQLALTNEDRERGKMYAQERQRKDLQTSAGDITQYLAGLGIVIKISRNEPKHTPRVAQLTQKTNQFNLTTKRYSEHQIEELAKNSCKIYTGDVLDKFGEYGITNVAIITLQDNEHADLDTFLMSCRIIGRNVQHAFLNFIIEELSASGIKTLSGSFVPSAKNKLCKDFLDEMGFILKRETETGTREYSLNLVDYISKARPFPEGFLTVTGINLRE